MSQFIVLSKTIFLVMVLACTAMAQDFPNKTIRLLIGFPPGGGADVVARQLAPRFSDEFGQQVIVESRSGAGGNIALEYLAKQAPDGYTLMLTTPTITVNPALYPKIGFDAQKDFSPIGLVATTVYVLVVHPSLPVTSVVELISLAKAKPLQLNYSSGGNGAAAHLAGELFRSMAGIKITHLPYKGVSQALMAVLSGEGQLTFATQPTALPHVYSKKLRALGVTSSKRSIFTPEIPTIAESALAGYETTAWFGVVGPAKMPQSVISHLNNKIRTILEKADVKIAMSKQSLEILSSTPDQFGIFMRDELIKWTKVVRESEMRID